MGNEMRTLVGASLHLTHVLTFLNVSMTFFLKLFFCLRILSTDWRQWKREHHIETLGKSLLAQKESDFGNFEESVPVGRFCHFFFICTFALKCQPIMHMDIPIRVKLSRLSFQTHFGVQLSLKCELKCDI